MKRQMAGARGDRRLERGETDRWSEERQMAGARRDIWLERGETDGWSEERQTDGARRDRSPYVFLVKTRTNIQKSNAIEITDANEIAQHF